jgi:hypothetical protein
MYTTGMRPVEAVTISKWTYISPTNIILQPAKGNSIRTFTETELTPGLVTAIQNQIDPYQGLTIRQLSSVTKKLLPVTEVSVNEKSIIDYMFRYNRVKLMAKSGMSDSAIQTAFGWSSPLLSISYRTALIFSPTPIPVMGYGTLTVNINQVGTADPTISEIVNFNGLTCAWARTGIGEITLTTVEGDFGAVTIVATFAQTRNRDLLYSSTFPSATTMIAIQTDLTGTPVDNWNDIQCEIKMY